MTSSSWKKTAGWPEVDNDSNELGGAAGYAQTRETLAF